MKTNRFKFLVAAALTLAALASAGPAVWAQQPTFKSSVIITGYNDGSQYTYAISGPGVPSQVIGPYDGSGKTFRSGNSDSEFTFGSGIHMSLDGKLVFANGSSQTDDSDLHTLDTDIYEIASQQDLDYLARIVKGKGATPSNDCFGLTFRQTADIAYNFTDAWDVGTEENNFTPIGGYGH